LRWITVILSATTFALFGCNGDPMPTSALTFGTTTSVSSPSGWLSIADKAALIVACVKERGFSAELVEGFGIYIEGPQLEAAEEAKNLCRDEIDARYADPPPLSDRELYNALVESVGCIREQGIELTAPPTFDAWVESSRIWTPYGEIPDSVDFWDLHSKCPQPGLGLTPSTVSRP